MFEIIIYHHRFYHHSFPLRKVESIMFELQPAHFASGLSCLFPFVHLGRSKFYHNTFSKDACLVLHQTWKWKQFVAVVLPDHPNFRLLATILCVCMCIYVCIYIYIHACMHACMHTYIHTYIQCILVLYIHTHIYIRTYTYDALDESCAKMI